MIESQEATYSLEGFDIGDYITFDRTFTRSDFDVFCSLSGDDNPLHHDIEFAKRSEFGEPIVPMHLTLSPLSMIAGTVFPGEPSLYLGHEVRASRPVFYNECLRYSARLTSINYSHRVLSIRVLVLRASEVVLDVLMRVKANMGHWSLPPGLPIRKGGSPTLALITGGTGAIGSAIALQLRREGWQVILQDRGDESKRNRVREELGSTGTDVLFVNATLDTAAGRRKLAELAGQRPELGLVVHVASPGVSANVLDLVAVNFAALQELIDATERNMLARQSGAVVLLGTTAMETNPSGWEAYVGAKSMAASLVDGFDLRSRAFGVRGLTLSPGLVDTEFSSGLGISGTPLLPLHTATITTWMHQRIDNTYICV